MALMEEGIDNQIEPTIGVDFKVKELEIENRKVKAQLWDTAGQEKYHAVITNYYKNSVGALILYDITNQDSFDKLDFWIKDIKNNSISDDCVIYIIGNKCDNEDKRVISREKGEEFAKLHNYQFYEISALNNSSNINELLVNLNKDILKNNPEFNVKLNSISGNHLNEEEKNTCFC